MPLERKLSAEELDFLEVLQDPIWLGEFLRSTADFSGNEDTRNEAAKNPWNYRWYQKDLLTDQNEFILLRGGRSIGKCHPLSSRIYTYPYGYMYIVDLIRTYKDKYFLLPTVNEKGEWVQRRAIIEKDGYVAPLRIITESGNKLDVTKNHPIMTPKGWVHADKLQVSDTVAVATNLPSENTNNAFHWAELRWLGYMLMSQTHIRVQMPLDVKFQANVRELRQIAEYFDVNLEKNRDGSYQLIRKKGFAKHHGSKVLKLLAFTKWNENGIKRIPKELKAERLSNVKIFLESLLSVYAEFTSNEVTIRRTGYPTVMRDIQELLLRFGVETTYQDNPDTSEVILKTRDYNAFYTLFSKFSIPGVGVKDLIPPVSYEIADGNFRFEPIVSIEERPPQPTWAIQVVDYENYISDGVHVHNSAVLEDKMIYNLVNYPDMFNVVKQSVLVTANVNQMTNILDPTINRIRASAFLREYLVKANSSKGTWDFTFPGNVDYRFHARIAGSSGENNMVGLHLPRIYGDEIQIFPQVSWVQLRPVLNDHETPKQVFVCGVPNGVREGSVMYMLDEKNDEFKKYRVPASENRVWTQENHIREMRLYGEESDEFQQLVLGRHGNATYAVIPRDKMQTIDIPFYSYAYGNAEQMQDMTYKQVLGLPKVTSDKTVAKVLSIDTGYTDPTIIQLIVLENGKWYVAARWKLTRIRYPEQADIIDWIDSFYDTDLIGIDLGAGGGGIGIMQDLTSQRFSSRNNYEKKIFGANFAANIEKETVMDVKVRTSAKSAAGEELASLVANGEMVFSELDYAALSQLERVSYVKRPDGSNQYFVLSETGKGKSSDDHIFASYIVFILTVGNLTAKRNKKRKLYTPKWV